MTKWKVKKTENLWVVFSHHGNECAWRTTYAAAITEAQKLARSVTVELPAGEDMEHAGGFHIWDRGYRICVSNGFENIQLYQDELKPLALALLAHHYKNQKDNQ